MSMFPGHEPGTDTDQKPSGVNKELLYLWLIRDKHHQTWYNSTQVRDSLILL